MNKARVLGILLFILGFYLMYKSHNSESGFLINALIGALTAAGFFFSCFWKFEVQKLNSNILTNYNLTFTR
ncbi:hypothetical protein A9996_16045 [Gelidibacter algens]|uniref:hypothetical protein n=1 Tax=Gelidibacter algens TaxID=49280 RepID=UPI000805F06D|nr:hypothetical protein [Gelidibacter algens]OBX23284.1 hypothetical protein A9996_16045 [Gelidibacter algens]